MTTESWQPVANRLLLLIPIIASGVALAAASTPHSDRKILVTRAWDTCTCCDVKNLGKALLARSHLESVTESPGSTALEESSAAQAIPEAERMPLLIGAQVLHTKVAALLSRASLPNVRKGDVNGLLMEISDLSQRLVQPSLQTIINMTDQSEHGGFQENTPTDLQLVSLDGPGHGHGHGRHESETLTAKGEIMEEGSEHDEKYLAILFLGGALTIGCFTACYQERYFPSIPYTVNLFALGILLSLIDHFQTAHGIMVWPAWHRSVEMWQSISPHMIFHIFLPALIFADAMKMNVPLVRRCIWQVLLLACPGVIMGTAMTGAFAKWVLPYNWGWSACLCFGAILSATDPVAVVSLFGSLGISPRLTMVISGESLVNDGTAIVAFSLMLEALQGTALTTPTVVKFFLRMTLIALVEGLVLGVITVICIRACSKKLGESDAMLQLMALITVAYMTFFLAENSFHTSGIVGLVVCGVVVARTCWLTFVSEELIKGVWEALEFMANTVIFMLAGLLFGKSVLSRQQDIVIQDVGWLLLLYAALTIFRAVMIGVLWIPMNALGHRLTLKDGLVMTWSGLRGAVSLAMAIMMDNHKDIDHFVGSRVIFHVGGMAMLTMFVNATTCGPLLAFLGMTAEEEAEEMKQLRIKKHMKDLGARTIADMITNGKDIRYIAADPQVVRSLIPSMKGTGAHGRGTIFVPESEENPVVRFYRKTFMQVVMSHYKECIANGIVPGYTYPAYVLIDSALESELDAEKPLADWDVVHAHLGHRGSSSTMNRVAQIFSNRPFSWFPALARMCPTTERAHLWIVFASLCFVEAHKLGRDQLNDLINIENGDTIETVVNESEVQCAKARECFAKVPQETAIHGKNKMCAWKVLSDQEKLLKSMVEDGRVTEKEFHHFMEDINEARFEIFTMAQKRQVLLELPTSDNVS